MDSMQSKNTLPKQSLKTKEEVEEEKDPLEEMLDRTGCKQIHYSLQVTQIS